jgi:hypothetical protein
MATRFKTGSKANYDQAPLPTGYENSYGPSEIFIPSCGLEDVDSSLFSLFDKEISPQITTAGSNDPVGTTKVPVIFAAGEKWAMLKRGRPLRDRNNSLLLPLITIMRNEVAQASVEDLTGRGINQNVGEIVIKRKLDKSDREYQNLINRILLTNQANVAAPTTRSSKGKSGQLTTSNEVGQLSSDKDIVNGALLKPNVLNNVYETIVVPTPQFYTAKYQVTIWAQYMQHTNQILERIITSFLPQGHSWKLETDKGYWFIAKVDEGTYSLETNFEDMAQQERFIKYSFSVNVPAYFFASSVPGNPIPVKRYVSSPSIKFETNIAKFKDESNKYQLGSDDPTLPLDSQQNIREDQRTPGWREQKTYPVSSNVNANDPALESMPRGYKTIKVTSTSANGETSYTGSSLDDLEIIVTD